MNNKGFTLVELLAVMVVLISISLVAVWGVTASLERRENKEIEEQVELAIGAAKIYFSLNKDKNCVSIQTLIDEKYIKWEEKVDKLEKTYSVVYWETDNEAGYSYVEKCS